MLAAVASTALSGAVGRAVSVEVHLSNGLPGFTIVGLPDAAVHEARDRVRAAILSSGLPGPMRRITANLARWVAFRKVITPANKTPGPGVDDAEPSQLSGEVE